MGDLLQELVGIEKACAEAFNRRDVTAILAHFDEQITGFSSTRHQRFHGLDELRQTFEYYLSEAEQVSYEFSEPEVVSLDGIAILSFYWKVTLKSGEKVTEITGRGSHVFRKTDDGWKIVHEHFSRAH